MRGREGSDVADTEPQAAGERLEFEIGFPELRPPIIADPPVPPDDTQVSREELELALERARLVADDCAAALKPALQAMEDGAWVSRRADEFSLALRENARVAAMAGQHPVEVIEAALNARTDGEDSGPLEFYAPRAEAEF